MPYVARDANEIEALREGRFVPVRKALGATAFGINELRLPPDGAGKEHDETHTGQEEIYLVLEGNGHMLIDGQQVDLHPRRYVFVPPETVRQVRAGSRGITYVCVGCPSGRAYEPRG